MGSLERRWNLDQYNWLGFVCGVAYETAIVGGICEIVGKFSQLVHTSGAVYVGQCGDARCLT